MTYIQKVSSLSFLFYLLRISLLIHIEIVAAWEHKKKKNPML